MASFVHVQPTTAIVRWYDEDNGYEQKLPFRAVSSLSFMGDDTVFIHGMHGQLDKTDMEILFELFVEHGITKAVAERHGKMVTRDLPSLLARAKAGK